MLTNSKRNKIVCKTSLITAIAVSVIAFSHGPLVSASTAKTTIDYHYHQNTYLNKLFTDNMRSSIAQDKIDYVTNQAFPSSASNLGLYQTIGNVIQLKPENAAIVMDGTPVVYLKNKAAADDVLRKLKLKYVSEAELSELEARKASSNTVLPPIKENESRLVDVHFSKDVSIVEENVAPANIVSEEVALSLLEKGTLDVTVERESNLKEVIPFSNQVVNDPTLTKGVTKEKQAGKNGAKDVTYHLVVQNGIVLNKDISSQQILEQPVSHIVVKGTKVIPSHGLGTFVWPTDGGYISSGMGYRWGAFHKGIDIARPYDKTIKAADNGIVVFAGYSGGFGNKIMINHQNGFITIYGHLSVIGVHVGQTVTRGSAIGIMGATGDATGVHLHFEIHKNGVLQNPLNYLR